MRIYRSGFLVVAAAVLATLSVARADDLTPQQIFQNHEAAVGYSLGDGNMKPYVMRWTVSWSDYKSRDHESHVVLRQAGAYYREDVAYSGAHTATGFDGTDFWQASPNANITADTGYPRTFDVTEAIISAEAYGPSLLPQLRGMQRDDYVVRIQPHGGMIADVYFNRSTWLVDQTIVDPDDAAIRVEYSDYKQFGPTKFATKRRLIVPSDYLNAQVFTTRVDDVKWDASITPDDLSAPSSTTYSSFPSSGSVTLPFDPRHHVIVEASINGVGGRFLIDTQVDGFYVDSLYANRAHIVSEPDVRFDYDDPSALVAMPTTDIALGGLTLKGVKVGVIDANVNELNFSNYDGILGLDFLAQAVTAVDFDAGTVTFTKPSAFQMPTGMYPLPITLGDQGAQSVAMVNGSSPMLCDLAISDDVAFVRFGPGSSVDKVQLGPFAANVNFPAVGHVDPTYDPTSTQAQCEIGFGMLGSMNMVIDYPDMEFYLTPAKIKR